MGLGWTVLVEHGDRNFCGVCFLVSNERCRDWLGLAAIVDASNGGLGNNFRVLILVLLEIVRTQNKQKMKKRGNFLVVVYASPRAQRISLFWCLLWYVGLICILGPLFVRATMLPKLFVDNWMSMLTVCVFECLRCIQFFVSFFFFFSFLVLKVQRNFCV